MNITRSIVDQAVAKNILNEDQGKALWEFLADKSQETPTFKAAHILYYLGGLIAIGAMTLFMTLGWERFGGAGLLLISLAYGAIALALTEFFLKSQKLAIPAGVTAALAVVMIPLAIYGLQSLMGYWPEEESRKFTYRDYHRYIDWRWLLMEMATVVAGVVALWRYRLPFLVLPIAVTLWYMSMDLTPFLFGDGSGGMFSEPRKLVSLLFGAAMLATAFFVDVRLFKSRDYAFWLYIFGVMTFWGGLTAMNSESELGKFFYCCINLAMIAAGAALSRRVFAVFGGIGVAIYLGHLSHTIFKDSMLFPLALSAIGLGIIASGVMWQRHEAAIGERLRSYLPPAIRDLVTSSKEF